MKRLEHLNLSRTRCSRVLTSEERVFPMYSNIKKLIFKEWANPEKLFLSRSFKRKYPFGEDDSAHWDKVLKVDAPVARISKRSSLLFADVGLFRDPIDGKIQGKRLWPFFAVVLLLCAKSVY